MNRSKSNVMTMSLFLRSNLVFAIFFLLFLPALAIANSKSANRYNLTNIVVVGGTHGNEYTGVWCIKALDRASAEMRSTFPSLNISTLLGNPQAFMENKRFVDEDLNRQFSTTSITMNKKADPDTLSQEARRAIEIDSILGSKLDDEPKADVVIDLHSTTSNMGLTIIVAEGDVAMTRAAAFVARKCQMKGQKVNCLVHTHPTREVRPNLSSTGKHGFTIEVGPIAQGVLRHDKVEMTEMAINFMLEYLHLYNSNSEKLEQILRGMYQSESFKVPCYRSANAIRKGEMSGKITWPCDDDNLNFPAYMIHKKLQDADFQLVKKGDPLFVDLDGNVIPYDGSFGESVYLMFVNEAGYYYESSGTGVSVAVKTQYDLNTGMLLEKEICTSTTPHE